MHTTINSHVKIRCGYASLYPTCSCFQKDEIRTQKKIFAGRWLLLYGILFGLSYPQEALFSSNQNTKFITGLARAGYGDIAADWMARITDPFPLFSHLLQWQYQLLGLYAGTHFSFFLIAGAYGILGVWLAKSFFEETEDRQRAVWVFCAAVAVYTYRRV